MVAPINYADLQLLSNPNRLVPIELSNNVVLSTAKTISLSAPNTVFSVNALGISNIPFINISVTVQNITNPTIVWQVITGVATLTNTSNSGCTVTYENMNTSSITIQASVTTDVGDTYSSTININKIQQGVTWSNLDSRNNDLGPEKISLGKNAGINSQSTYAIALGAEAGTNYQSGYSVAIGNLAGNSNQGISAVAVGKNAGNLDQGNYAVAIGEESGKADQGNNSIGIGYRSGNSNQSLNSIAIGNSAGYINQKEHAIAIGTNAGNSNQGLNSIAIGTSAGIINQANNSIILNASSGSLNTSTENSFNVSPVREVNLTNNLLNYNTTTKEIGYVAISNIKLPYPVGGLLTENIENEALTNTSTIIHAGSLSGLYLENLATIPNYSTNPTTGSASRFSTKTWFFMPVMFKYTATYTKIGLACAKTIAGSPTSYVRVLVYSNTKLNNVGETVRDRPENLLYDWGFAPTTYTVSGTLYPDIWLTGSFNFTAMTQYWFAIMVDGDSADFRMSVLRPSNTNDMRFNIFSNATPGNTVSRISSYYEFGSVFGNASSYYNSYTVLPPDNPSITNVPSSSSSDYLIPFLVASI